MPGFTIRQLEYFVTVAKAGSLVAGAQQLHVTQPTVSIALSKLEDRLGLEIFVRHHARGVSLTPAGQRLLPEARNLLRHLEQFENNAMDVGSSVSGRLEVGCFRTLAPRYMPKLIRGFTREHPSTEIRIHEGYQEDLVQGILTGRFDLAFLYDEDLPTGLHIDVLSEHRPYVLLPESHRLAQQQRVSLSSLRDDPFILFDVSPSREYFTSVLRQAGIEPRVAFASPSFEMVRGMVGQGHGYSLLVTKPHSERSYDGEIVVARPIRGPVRPSHICLARRAKMRPTRLAEVFTEFCGASMGQSKRNPH
jgi:DNA-binding transcriptional LysR family regulator